MKRNILAALLGCSATALMASASPAQAQQKIVNFNIPSETISKAIVDFASQSGLQIIAPTGQLHALTTPALVGAFDVRGGLDRLLASTPLRVTSQRGSVIVLGMVEAPDRGSLPRRPVTLTPTAYTSSAPVQPAPAAEAPVAISQPASAVAAQGNEDIIVTANKRSENVQDIPKSVQVVSSAALQRQNVTDISDLQKIVPTIAGTGQTLAIRGVGTGASTVSAQSKVGIVLDDVPQPSRSTIANNLMDIDRVEVLPGPQGTLAGRNATGGLVNMVTRGPSATWTGFVNAVATSDREQQLAGFVAGPIADRVQISMSQYYKGFRGLYKNIQLNQWASNWVVGSRNKVKMLLTDDLTVTGTFFYQRMHQNGVAGNSGGSPTGGVPIIYAYVPAGYRFTTDIRTPPAGFAALEPGVTASKDNRSYSSPLNGTADTSSVGGIGKIEYVTPGGVTLTSITSYLDEKTNVRADFCGCTINPLDSNTRPEFDGYLNLLNGSKYVTQEARLNSPTHGKLQYVAGLFYSDLQQTYNYARFINPVNWNRLFGTKSISGYAHADYLLTDKLKLQAGLRWEHDDIRYTWTFLPILATAKVTSDGVVRNFGVTNQLIQTQNHNTANFVNFDMGAQYRITPDVMVYGTFSRAQQGPIYDGEDNITAIQRALQALPQEKVENYEIGFKSQLFDRRLTLNVSAFQGDYDNYQVQTVVNNPDPTQPPVLKIASVGKVRTRGVELTASARIAKGLRSDFNLAYTEAKILDFPNAPCFSGAIVGQNGCYTVNAGTTQAYNTQGSLGGQLLNRAPKVRLTWTMDYGVPVGSGDFEAFIAPLVKFATAQRNDLLRTPQSYLPATTYVDVNLGLRNRKFTAELFVRNLFKEKAETYSITSNGFSATTAGDYVLSRQLDRINDRYIGARLRYNF